MLLHRLAIDLKRLHYKATYGGNRGWRRSRLGGRSGSHYYAWWATKASPPVKENSSFADAPEGAVFLRDIRHHDDHTPLAADDFATQYLPVSVADLRQEAYAPEPWTPVQSKFARTRGAVRILKGHPGSGKTSALLHAADSSNSSNLLYLTFSADLAALARDYFERYCPADRVYTVLTVPELFARLAPDAQLPSNAEAREHFRRDVAPFQRSLGAWNGEIDALWDEMHAHLAGAAMPEKAGRFPKADKVHLPFAAYLKQRARYLGGAADAVVDAAAKLERLHPAPLADRYFPDLALAWRAAHTFIAQPRLVPEAMFQYRCIAVDEVQDLTPLEAYLVLAVARVCHKLHDAPLLLAGDEAQTVRPTDFEWAWLNDMAHDMISTPADFKLAVNLRSPRRIAGLVNRVWEYYGQLQKIDRPSGSGYAEIDDDSPDQVLYCSAHAGETGQALIENLAQREGMAVVAFDPSRIAARLRPLVLTPTQIKGLDFHSVCLVDAGRLLANVIEPERAGRAAEIDALRKRLAIDQLRVAVSRPTERLIWIEIDPNQTVLDKAGAFLRESHNRAMAPLTAEGLVRSLEEDELDIEERLQRCQHDARQFLSVKPDLAWSRASHAVSLLGTLGQPAAVEDEAARNAAHLTLAEVAFQLAYRKVRLSPELGRPDLFQESSWAARLANRQGLANAVLEIGAIQSAPFDQRLNAIAGAIQAITRHAQELESWLIVEIQPHVDSWIADLERSLHVADNVMIAVDILPPFFDALNLPDAAARRKNLGKRAIDLLIKSKRFGKALDLLEKQAERQPKLEAECLEELGEHARAAAIYEAAGDLDKALRCFRSVPDFASALRLVRTLENHPARESLDWLAELEKLLAKKPDKFNRTMTMPEKKLLEAMMERALGVQRKKPAAKKTATPAARRPPTRKTKPGG